MESGPDKMFTCPKCGGPHFNSNTEGLLICASVSAHTDHCVIPGGCGWTGWLTGPSIWISQNPDFDRQVTHVIVAQRQPDGSIGTFGAVWLNKMELYNEVDDAEEIWTCFATPFKHTDYEPYYERLDNIVAWALMPIYPTPTEKELLT